MLRHQVQVVDWRVKADEDGFHIEFHHRLGLERLRHRFVMPQ
jgi:hypothetical protein